MQIAETNDQERHAHSEIYVRGIDQDLDISENMLNSKYEEKVILVKLFEMGFTPFHIEYLVSKHKLDMTMDNFIPIIVELIDMEQRERLLLQREQRERYISDELIQFSSYTTLVVLPDISEIQVASSLSESDVELCGICVSNEKSKCNLPCGHEFCSACFKAYLDNRILNAQVDLMNCPQQGCEHKIPQEVIKNTVSSDKFGQYRYFLERQAVDKNENLKWCPKPDCVGYVQKGSTSVVSCEWCGQKVCFLCGNPDHTELGDCSKVIEVQLLQVVKAFGIKNCPRCKARIQKSQGCNHMTCYNCRYQFCWVCLQKYHDYHYRYWSIRGCAIWSSGRFGPENTPYDPDVMRHIFLLPRIIIYILRGPLIFLRLFFKSSYKAFKMVIKPAHSKIKNYLRRTKCLCFIIGYFFMMMGAIIFAILVYPIVLVATLSFELRMLCIKKCAY